MSDATDRQSAEAQYRAELAQLQKNFRESLEAELLQAGVNNKLQAERRASVTSKQELLLSLIKRRLALHLSQDELARRAGMQQSAIGRIEAGRANPTLDTVLKILTALDVTLAIQSDRIVKSN